jgi:hypothetical protein
MPNNPKPLDVARHIINSPVVCPTDPDAPINEEESKLIAYCSQHIHPFAYILAMPFIVLRLCTIPATITTWLAINMLLMFNSSTGKTDFSLRDIANLAKISKDSVLTHVNKLVDLGLLEVHAVPYGKKQQRTQRHYTIDTHTLIKKSLRYMPHQLRELAITYAPTHRTIPEGQLDMFHALGLDNRRGERVSGYGDRTGERVSGYGDRTGEGVSGYGDRTGERVSKETEISPDTSSWLNGSPPNGNGICPPSQTPCLPNQTACPLNQTPNQTPNTPQQSSIPYPTMSHHQQQSLAFPPSQCPSYQTPVSSPCPANQTVAPNHQAILSEQSATTSNQTDKGVDRIGKEKEDEEGVPLPLDDDFFSPSSQVPLEMLTTTLTTITHHLHHLDHQIAALVDGSFTPQNNESPIEPHIPPTPIGQTPLSRSVWDIWSLVTGKPLQESDKIHLERLVARFRLNPEQGEYAAYWLGRAIMDMHFITHDPNHPGVRYPFAYLQRILERWYTEYSWGSDSVFFGSSPIATGKESQTDTDSPAETQPIDQKATTLSSTDEEQPQPLMDHPAVMTYRHHTDQTISTAQARFLQTHIAPDPVSIEHWQEVCHTFVICGWNTQRLDNMVDRYHKEQSATTTGEVITDAQGRKRLSRAPFFDGHLDGRQAREWCEIFEQTTTLADQQQMLQELEEYKTTGTLPNYLVDNPAFCDPVPGTPPSPIPPPRDSSPPENANEPWVSGTPLMAREPVTKPTFLAPDKQL